jgi:hypothetical protein
MKLTGRGAEQRQKELAQGAARSSPSPGLQGLHRIHSPGASRVGSCLPGCKPIPSRSLLCSAGGLQSHLPSSEGSSPATPARPVHRVTCSSLHLDRWCPLVPPQACCPHPPRLSLSSSKPSLGIPSHSSALLGSDSPPLPTSKAESILVPNLQVMDLGGHHCTQEV